MKKIVNYTRYSTDMQRMDSCADQERNIRASLDRLGIDHQDAIVIRDEAESGTKSSRDGFQHVQAMINRAEVGILAVDDQSRLTRADNASAFIQDLVFAAGRFISTSEGIDTQRKGWELSVKAMEMKNSATIRNLSDLVRRGQEGRVLNDGSAGDYPFGYESYYLDPNWAEQLARRGPKPKKGLQVCDAEAVWVRQVFTWFNEGQSIAWIAKELTRQGVSKGRRSTTRGWHHQQVHRLLTNEKYIGQWIWKATTTIRDSKGRKKQVAVPLSERVVRARPELRIIDQENWEAAQRRLAELHEKFGFKDGQRKRGPKAHPSAVYPQSLLGGLLVCGKCGANLHYQGSGSRRYYVCSGRHKGLCDMAAQVPAERAEKAMIDFLTDQLCGWPDWIQAVYRRSREVIQEALARVPEKYQQDNKRLADVRRQTGNLVAALADGTLTSAAVKDKLAELEAEALSLQHHIEEYQSLQNGAVSLPDDDWLAEQLCQWANTLNEDTPRMAAVLRQAIEEVTAHVILAPGKRRGYTQLRFRIRGWESLRSVLGDQWPRGISEAANATPGEQGDSPEFTLDLGEPSPMDRWAPQIATWRGEGVTWEEIVRRTGLDLNRAFIAWKRYTGAQPGGTEMA